MGEEPYSPSRVLEISGAIAGELVTHGPFGLVVTRGCTIPRSTSVTNSAQPLPRPDATTVEDVGLTMPWASVEGSLELGAVRRGAAEPMT